MPDGYTLTAAGWPRPRAPKESRTPGLPVPWVAPQENLGEVNEGRLHATSSGAICQVCGGGFQVGDDAYGFITLVLDGEPQTDPPLEFGDALADLLDWHGDDWVTFLDGAIMHWKCARLSAAMCPHIRNRTDLICIRVMANDATPRLLDGKHRPTYSVQEAFYAPWPTTLPA